MQVRENLYFGILYAAKINGRQKTDFHLFFNYALASNKKWEQINDPFLWKMLPINAEVAASMDRRTETHNERRIFEPF